MTLDERTLRLIAVGASISANCQPCLQTTVAKALESGANEQEIAEAIWVGAQVRRGAASKMDKVAARVNRTILASKGISNDACGCA
jgi:AhpD family alkylhydroperoxidase